MRSATQLVGAALFFLSASICAWAQQGHNNITQVLAGRADYSLLASYLVKTGVAYEIDSRSSITVLAASNKILLPVVQQHPISAVADILRYHVLLQYLDSAQLHGTTTTTVTTLYQTTGRAAGDGGIVDVALEADGSVSVGQRGQAVRSARILQPISANPYNLSVWDVSEVMLPAGLAQASDAPVNLTDVLRRAGSFTTVVALLQATGLEQELQSRLGASSSGAAAGLTLLLPDDAVFARTFTTAQMERLSLEQKAALLRYHALPAYYPLDYFHLLDSNTVLATLATSSPSQADYLLSVSSSAGKVFVGTGIVSAGLGERAVYQNYPAAVLSVDNVLLPKEVFASFPPASAPDTAAASSPSIAATPTSLPDTTSAPAPAASPPWPPAPTPTPSPAAAAATAPDAPPASSPAPAAGVAAPSTSPKSSAPGPAPPHHSVAPAAGPSRGGFGTGPSEAQVGAAAGHFSLVAALALSSSACATTWLFFL